MLLKEAKHKDQLLLSANEQINLLSRRLENIGNDFDAICNDDDVLAESKNETSLKQEICIVKKEKKSRSKNTNADKSDNAEFEVEQILDHTNNIIARKFLIRWKGYDSGHDSWVLQKQLNCPELLADYSKRKNV